MEKGAKPGANTSADLLGQYTDFLTSNPSRSDRKILKATLCFIKRKQPELDRQALSGFLDSDPPRESSKGILPLDELTERLELTAKMEDRIRIRDEDYELDDHGFAALLIAPLQVLQSANELSRNGYLEINAIKVALDNIHDFVRLFLTREDKAKTGIIASVPASTSMPASSRKRDILDVAVAAEDAFKMKRAFDLQWAFIQIAALTGAADVDDDVVDTDDSSPPEEGLIEESIDIRSWLDGIVPRNGDDDNVDDDG
ncbi:hypothetical protein B0H67DRAFT_644417 [Lasiosphaeris hirsuta]|uniref:Uncharacterized protein n=1 Tax=Lasiosphaeris hirsuta TaxID=260670 RepID=A0AA40AF33_9PEZI|nr:hypothetical protein B0H67DRAFT_644417 [Lasiosphaeris hirsuta]